MKSTIIAFYKDEISVVHLENEQSSKAVDRRGSPVP